MTADLYNQEEKKMEKENGDRKRGGTSSGLLPKIPLISTPITGYPKERGELYSRWLALPHFYYL